MKPPRREPTNAMSDMAYAVHTRTCTYLLDDDGICRWTLSPTGISAPGADRCVGAQFVASLDLNEAGGLVGELRIGAAALFARTEGGRFVLLRTAPIEHVEFRAEGEPSAAQPAPSAPPAAPLAPTMTASSPVPLIRPMEPRLPQPTFPPLDRVAPAAPPVARPAAPPVAAPRTAPPPPVAPPRTTPPPPPVTAPRTTPPPAPPPQPRASAPPAAPIAPFPRASFPSAEEILEVEELSVEDLVTFSEVTLTIPLYRPESQPDRPPSAPRRGMLGPGKLLR